MSIEGISLEGLEDQVRALAVAESPAEVFKALLEGARLAAPRASVFLVRQSQIKGWGAVGYPTEAAKRQREYIGPVAEGWLGEALRAEHTAVAEDAERAYPAFGQPAPNECVGLAVRVKGRPIALLTAERSSGELPWDTSVLGILLRVAQLRLDLDLLRRKLAAGAGSSSVATDRSGVRPVSPQAPARPSAAAEPPPAGTHVTPEPSPEAVSAVAEAAQPSLEPIASGQDDPRIEAATRYARLVATDIRLYNEDTVVEGRREGDLAERLRESLQRGKQTFVQRHGDLGERGLAILRAAYVEVLAGGDADLVPDWVID
jgi:hypothetical protein